VLCPHAKGAKKLDVMDGVSIHRYRYAPESLESLVNNGGIIGNLKQSPVKWLLVPFFMLSQLISTCVAIRKFKPDIIHAHWIVPQGLILVVAQLLVGKTPFILTSHGADLFALRGRLLGKLKSMVLNRATYITVVSEVMKQQAVSLGANIEKISVMPMGVDFSKFKPKDIARNKNEILFVGRLVEKKGVAYLIHAMDIVQQQLPDVHLNIIGFGPEEQSLKQLVNSLNLNARVSFLGAKKQDELVDHYQSASLFVAPFIEASNGDQEGLGLVTIEAIASKCPVLIGDVKAVADIPVERVCVADAVVFADKIIKCLTCGNYNANLQEFFRLKFDWEFVAKTYRDLFQSKVGQ
jgi:glycosyltransferase involved in cell wall biosynthesis